MTVAARGVYAALAEVGGSQYPAAVNVGIRPTFESDGKLLVEAHLIDFEGEIYGSNLRLAFLDRLRDERRFATADELVVQMNKDVARARQLVGAAQTVGAQ